LIDRSNLSELELWFFCQGWINCVCNSIEKNLYL